MKEVKNFIFDLDGTLIDSSIDILSSLERAYIYSNLKRPKKLLNKKLIGPPIYEIVKSISPKLHETEITNICLNYRKLYDNNNKFNNTRLYEGIEEFLEEAFLRKKTLFVTTNKPEKPTIVILKKLNIDKFFSYVICSNSNSKKYTKSEMINEIIQVHNLKKDETVMVGDTFTDMLAAKENNISGVACTYGYENNLTRLILDCTLTVDRPTDLIQLFDAHETLKTT